VLSFIKKDLLLFWRDRKEIITILALPILLIIVLNFAFAGLFGNKDELSMDLEVAVVNHDDQTKSMERLKEKLDVDASLGEEEALAIVEQARHIEPIELLMTYLNSEGISEWVRVYTLKEDEAISRVEKGELDGIIVIPEGFSADSLYAAFLGEAPSSSMKFKMEKETNESKALYNIVNGFIEQLNYQFALQKTGNVTEGDVILPNGGFEEIGSGEGFTLTEYMTIAMAALFALILTGTIATKTGVEIREQVFKRIILTNSRPIYFLIGKMVSTFFLTWLQMMFVFTFSHLILKVFPDRSISFWLGTVGNISILSLALAGLSAVFTAVLLRMKNIDAANAIFMLVVIFCGVVAGNFAPNEMFPEWLQRIGEWTPNGLFMVSLSEWAQFEELSSMFMPSLSLVGFFLLCTIIGLAFYPKRGETK